MELKAYAKINLTLDITGRRDDGYHTLDTVMHTVSLYDKVQVERTDKAGIHLRTDKGYLPVDAKNTACKAAAVFFEKQGIKNEGLEIYLQKNIPTRAGMGGGSADAAAVLRCLNELFEQGLTTDELARMGAEIGADVPFCVKGGSCRCQGVGEIMTPAPLLPDCYIVICKPPAGMSTPRAYALIDDSGAARTQDTEKMISALETGDLRLIGRTLSNSFENAMKLMQVRNVKKTLLSAGAAGAVMTGSGSAVFGLFETLPSAEYAMSLLEDKGEVFLSRPIYTM